MSASFRDMDKEAESEAEGQILEAGMIRGVERNSPIRERYPREIVELSKERWRTKQPTIFCFQPKELRVAVVPSPAPSVTRDKARSLVKSSPGANPLPLRVTCLLLTMTKLKKVIGW